MQITHAAVSPDRTVHRLTEEGCNNLQRLHKQQLVKGWQYGLLKDVDSLIAKVVGTLNPEAKKAIDENAALKQELAALKKQLAEKATAKVDEPAAPAGVSVHWASIAANIAKATTIEEAQKIAGEDTRPGIVAALNKRIAELESEGDANG